MVVTILLLVLFSEEHRKVLTWVLYLLCHLSRICLDALAVGSFYLRTLSKSLIPCGLSTKMLSHRSRLMACIVWCNLNGSSFNMPKFEIFSHSRKLFPLNFNHRIGDVVAVDTSTVLTLLEFFTLP